MQVYLVKAAMWYFALYKYTHTHIYIYIDEITFYLYIYIVWDVFEYPYQFVEDS